MNILNYLKKQFAVHGSRFTVKAGNQNKNISIAFGSQLHLILATIVMLFLVSCGTRNTYTPERLYVQPAGTSQTDTLPVFPFKAKGGERHINVIDWGEDSLPTSTRSCHHGGEVLPPQKGSIQAAYDAKNIYLHIDWDDKTGDMESPRWNAKKQAWTTKKDDGISLIFSKNPLFNCAATCHMFNWKVEENKFTSDYRMFSEKEKLPFVLLRASKTGNRPLFGVMDKDGKKNAAGEPLFEFNSANGYGKPSTLQLYQVMGGADDRPSDRSASDELFIMGKGSTFLDGKMTHKGWHWTAEITAPLEKLGYTSLKKGDTIYIAIGIFDATHTNHSITDTIIAEIR